MNLAPVVHDPDRPIGVFDSGIGGLSVLNALRAELPHERFIYFADTGYAPYGERDDAYVIARARLAAQSVIGTHHSKALVVACNTATAAAIDVLRAEYPGLPLVGIEPALKPASAISRTGHIAVIATRGTLGSRKFEALRASLAPQAQFKLVACDGLASAIERGDQDSIAELCRRYMAAAGPFGAGPEQSDTLVLGCTHYPLVSDELRRHTGPQVQFIDTGAPVAQQTRRLLAAGGQLASSGTGAVALMTSGSVEALRVAAERWLASPVKILPMQ